MNGFDKHGKDMPQVPYPVNVTCPECQGDPGAEGSTKQCARCQGRGMVEPQEGGKMAEEPGPDEMMNDEGEIVTIPDGDDYMVASRLEAEVEEHNASTIPDSAGPLEQVREVIHIALGSKYIFLMPPNIEHDDLMHIQREIQTWWESEEPFLLLSGNIELVRVDEDNSPPAA